MQREWVMQELLGTGTVSCVLEDFTDDALANYLLVELLGVAAKPFAGFNTQKTTNCIGQHKFYDANSGTV